MSLREDPYGTRKRFTFASDLIAVSRPRRVLDFGCGSGVHLTLPLAQSFPEVEFLGVDSDAASIAYAREACYAPNLRFAPAAALDVDDRFDLIIASEVIEHVESPAGLLRALAARLNPGGRLLLTLPNGYGPFELAELTRDILELCGLLPVARRLKHALAGAREGDAGRNTCAASPHVNFFSLEEIRCAIRAAGLQEVAFRPRTVLCGFGFDLIVRGERLAAWNAVLADRLPAAAASDWMFVLGRAEKGGEPWEYRRGPYARLRRRLHDAVTSLAPHERRAILAHRARHALGHRLRRLRDAGIPTYAARVPGAPLARRFAQPPLAALELASELIRGAADRYVEHRFDLLGSGWTRVAHGVACRGLHGIVFPRHAEVQADADGAWLVGRLNAANLAEAQRIWRLVSPGYRPIDWQLDFKSGFRWSEATPAHAIRFGDVRGADVKLPWELARLQHLPQLAFAYMLAAAGAPGFRAAARYAREFRDQLLDFLATNPPRFGVNWASSMDVAIRVANLLAAYDLFRAAGASFDAAFEQLVARAVEEHASHVAGTLDWHPRYRGNHYLCGIAGLLFAAVFLGGGRAAMWRRFATAALEVEVQRQFLPDGGSFEAATGYHRLSGEAAVYASVLVAGELKESHFQRLASIARFVAETARPDGCAPQIGDQDSGRFLKMEIRFARPGGADWDENFLDHGHLVAAASALVDCGDFRAHALAWPIEHAVVSGLRGAMSTRRALPRALRRPAREGLAVLERLRGLPADCRARYRFEFVGTRTAVAFPDFGLYLWRAGNSYACIRCGPIGLNGLGAHAHNDALSLELVCDGRDIARDPGSYLYTPLPEERDRYRSVGAHFAPRIGHAEPATLGPGPFRLGDEARARCVHFDETTFLGVHYGYGAPVYRLLVFDGATLVVEDFSEAGRLSLVTPRPGPVPFSPKYGVRLS